MDNLKRWLWGPIPPAFAGFRNGLYQAVALFVLTYLIAVLSAPNLPESVRLWAPPLIMALRLAEGLVKQKKDPGA